MGFGSRWWLLSKQLAYGAIGLLVVAHVTVYVWPQEIVSKVHPVLLGLWPHDLLVTFGTVRFVYFSLLLAAGAVMLAVGLPLGHFLLTKVENKLYPRMKLFNEAGAYIIAALLLQAVVPIQDDFEKGFFFQREKLPTLSTKLHYLCSLLLYFVVVYHGYTCLVLMHYSRTLPCRRETAEGLFRRRAVLVAVETAAALVAAYFHPCHPFRDVPIRLERELVQLEADGPKGWALRAYVEHDVLGIYASVTTAAVAVFLAAFCAYIASFATDFELIRKAVADDRRRRMKR